MGHKLTNASTAAVIETDDTVTFQYPAGTTAASYITGSGAKMWVDGLQTLFTQGASNFTLAYGGPSITMTYKGDTDIPIGSDLSLQLPTPDTLADVLPTPLNAVADSAVTGVADIALSTSNTYTDAAVNGAVNAAIAEVNTDVDDLQTTVNTLIARLEAAGILAA